MKEICKCKLCIYFEEGGLPPSKGAERKRFRMWFAQGRVCFYCEEELELWSAGILEHIIPRSKGGNGVVLACKECDKLKGSLGIEDYSRRIKRMQSIQTKVFEYNDL